MPFLSTFLRVIGVGFGVIGLLLTILVQKGAPLPGEIGLTKWIVSKTPSALNPLAEIFDFLLTDLAAPIVFLVVLTITSWRWGRCSGFFLLIAGIGTGMTRLADLVRRPRPGLDLSWSEYTFGSGGYPSGHAVFVILIFGTLIMMSHRHLSTRGSRKFSAVLCSLGFSCCWLRISTGQHWPADVLGGLFLGCPILVLISWIEIRLSTWLLGKARLGQLLGIQNQTEAKSPTKQRQKRIPN